MAEAYKPMVDGMPESFWNTKFALERDCRT